MSTDKDKVTRKLRAILSADVKGYSILMANDEAYTIKKLEAYRDRMSDLIQSHSGRVVDAVGDNLLAEFSSVVDAVRCAVEIQKDLQQKNADLPTDKRLEFRLGVNIGDVVQEGDRIYGNGVNVAARIEGLAEPGGICISRNAYSHVRDKLELGYEYLGEHSVKNIKRPVRVYKVLMDPEDAGKLIGDVPKPAAKKWIWATAVLAIIVITAVIWQVYQTMTEPEFELAKVEEMAFPLPDKPSIAVLPFDNMSGDPEQNYFSDGLTEQVISALSKVHNLFVIARNSTFTYKGKPVKVQQVAEELGIRYVLEGSVQKAEDRVRITLQLIDALKGHHLWSETYDRDLKDIFALQDEIAMKVVTAMRVKLTVGEQARMLGKGTKNLKAYLKLLEAVEPFFLFKKEANVRAKQLLEEAIALDPEFSNAYSFLGFCHYWDGFYGWSKSTPKSNKRAFELSQKALTLDDSNAQAYEMISKIYVNLKKYENAIAEAQKAIELNPNGTWFVFNMGWVLRCAGRPEEAIALLKKSIRLNPISKSPVFDTLGRAYFLARRYEEAIAAHKTAIKLDPDNQYAHIGLAATYTVLGKEGEARTEVSEILRIEPGFSIKKYAKFMYFQVGLEPEIEALRKAGLPEYPLGKEPPEKPSIAVLPFDNLSDDPEQGYLADGLTDELIGDLAKIDGIFVISRNSAFTYKGKEIKITDVAKELNVRYIVEGSVQRAGNRLRIRAQLIDGETDHHLWAESYDGTMDDIFVLQDSLTEKIVSSLAITLSSSERERVGSKGTDNIMAYEAFLKGREHIFNMTPKDLVKAIEYYKQAVIFDPNFSRAYAAIGVVYQIGGNLNWSTKMGGSHGTHRLLSRKYLELGMKNPTFEAYNLYAAKEIHKRNFKESEVFAKKAHEYAPNSSEGLRWLGWILAFTGRSEESIEYFHKAIRLDPFDKSLNTPVSNAFIGVNHFSMGNLEEAITYLEKGLSLNPKLTNFSCFLAASHALLGHNIEAEKTLAEYLKEFPEWLTPTIQLLYSSWPFKDSKVFDRLAQGLVKAGLQGDPKDYYKVIKENKLNDKEIRKLLFGKTSTGYAFGLKGLEWVSRIGDDGEEEYSIMGQSYTGRAWIEDENICFLREQHLDGLKNCMEVYRNPDGDELTKTEYFRITDYGILLFSVDN